MKEIEIKNQVCEFCGGYFTAYRDTAKYCSDRCRAASHRQAAKFKTIELQLGKSLLKRRSIKQRFDVLMQFEPDILKVVYEIERKHGSEVAEEVFEIAWMSFRKFIEKWNKMDILRMDFGKYATSLDDVKEAEDTKQKQAEKDKILNSKKLTFQQKQDKLKEL